MWLILKKYVKILVEVKIPQVFKFWYCASNLQHSISHCSFNCHSHTYFLRHAFTEPFSELCHLQGEGARVVVVVVLCLMSFLLEKPTFNWFSYCAKEKGKYETFCPGVWRHLMYNQHRVCYILPVCPGATQWIDIWKAWEAFSTFLK